MKAFVTGGSGFIGGHLIDALLHSGWSVRALVHRASLVQSKSVETISGDICDSAVLASALDGAEVVFHLASALGSAVIGKNEFWRVNVGGTAVLIEAAQKKGISRFVHVSSAGVLGSVSPGDTADETYPPRPVSVYDRTKLEAEKIALNSASTGLDVVVIRPGWAYGPRDRRTFKLIRRLEKGKLTLLPGGKARQTPVFIEDLVAGILLALQSGKSGQIYHLAGEEILTAAEIVAAIRRALGKSWHSIPIPLFLARMAALFFEAIYFPFRKEPPFSRAKLSFFIHSKPLAIEKARTELGYIPRVHFRQGLERTISWYRGAGWL